MVSTSCGGSSSAYIRTLNSIYSGSPTCTTFHSAIHLSSALCTTRNIDDKKRRSSHGQLLSASSHFLTCIFNAQHISDERASRARQNAIFGCIRKISAQFSFRLGRFFIFHRFFNLPFADVWLVSDSRWKQKSSRE